VRLRREPFIRREYQQIVLDALRMKTPPFNCGFWLQYGLGDAPNLTKSLKYYETSIGGLDGPDESGMFEYARCLQDGELGFDVSLEEASDFYGLIT
jgi:hypothetical protein